MSVCDGQWICENQEEPTWSKVEMKLYGASLVDSRFDVFVNNVSSDHDLVCLVMIPIKCLSATVENVSRFYATNSVYRWKIYGITLKLDYF